jgi:hypothetical protein
VIQCWQNCHVTMADECDSRWCFLLIVITQAMKAILSCLIHIPYYKIEISCRYAATKELRAVHEYEFHLHKYEFHLQDYEFHPRAWTYWYADYYGTYKSPSKV